MEKLLHLIVFTFAVMTAQSIEAKIFYTEEVASLASMLKKGEIKESDLKEDLYTLGMDRYFTKKFKGLGYGFRVSELTDSWKLFEDEGHFVLMGVVYRDESNGYTFVWILKDELQTSGDLPTLFLKIGNQVIEGKIYPKNIIPN